MKKNKNLAQLLQIYFTDYLISQKKVSPNTISSYRDTFRLLLQYAKERTRKQPAGMELDDLKAPLICSFLNYLEKERELTARSRNQRLAAIKSFFKHVSFEIPEQSGLIQQVLAIPIKRYERKLIEYLTQEEVDALLAVPDRKTWAGHRDLALLATAIQTGLRVSELTGLKRENVIIGTTSYIRCLGKGRKERCTPLTKSITTILRGWFKENGCEDPDLIFKNSRGGRLSNDGVQYLLDKHVTVAKENCSSLKQKRITPHVLRHTTAMQLLQAGIDCSVIALWLGHESPETTQMYVEADLKMKEEILNRTSQSKIKIGRYKPEDSLMSFLKGL